MSDDHHGVTVRQHLLNTTYGGKNACSQPAPRNGRPLIEAPEGGCQKLLSKIPVARPMDSCRSPKEPRWQAWAAPSPSSEHTQWVREECLQWVCLKCNSSNHTVQVWCPHPQVDRPWRQWTAPPKGGTRGEAMTLPRQSANLGDPQGQRSNPALHPSSHPLHPFPTVFCFLSLSLQLQSVWAAFPPALHPGFLLHPRDNFSGGFWGHLYSRLHRASVLWPYEDPINLLLSSQCPSAKRGDSSFFLAQASFHPQPRALHRLLPYIRKALHMTLSSPRACSYSKHGKAFHEYSSLPPALTCSLCFSSCFHTLLQMLSGLPGPIWREGCPAPLRQPAETWASRLVWEPAKWESNSGDHHICAITLWARVTPRSWRQGPRLNQGHRCKRPTAQRCRLVIPG